MNDAGICHNIFTIQKLSYQTMCGRMKNSLLQRFFHDLVKKASSLFLVKWFNR